MRIFRNAITMAATGLYQKISWNLGGMSENE